MYYTQPQSRTCYTRFTYHYEILHAKYPCNVCVLIPEILTAYINVHYTLLIYIEHLNAQLMRR